MKPGLGGTVIKRTRVLCVPFRGLKSGFCSSSADQLLRVLSKKNMTDKCVVLELVPPWGKKIFEVTPTKQYLGIS